MLFASATLALNAMVKKLGVKIPRHVFMIQSMKFALQKMMVHNCQAQLQFNFNFNLEAEIALLSKSPTTYPPTDPPLTTHPPDQ